jgi:hypothetical protein
MVDEIVWICNFPNNNNNNKKQAKQRISVAFRREKNKPSLVFFDITITLTHS